MTRLTWGWRLLAILVLAGCATPREAGRATGTLYTFVVLSADGAPMARAITSAATCPTIELDGVARAMTVRALPGTMPLRPTVSPPSASKPSAFPGPDVRGGDSRRRCARRDRWPRASLAQSDAADDRRARRQRLPDGRRRYRCSRPATIRCNGRSPRSRARPRRARPTSSSMSATIITAKTRARPATPVAPAAPGATAGTCGKPISSRRRRSCWPPHHGSSCAAITNPARAPGRAGGDSWIRDRLPRGRTATTRRTMRSATSANPTPFRSAPGSDTQFIVFDSSRVGVTPLRPGSVMYENYRAQFEHAFALASRRANTFFMDHHPVLAFAPNPSKPAVAVSGQRGIAVGAAGARAHHPVPLQHQGAALRARASVRGRRAFRRRTRRSSSRASAATGSTRAFHCRLAANLTPAPGAIVSSIVATNRFGFMTMQRDDARWTMTARDVKGNPMTTCT